MTENTLKVLDKGYVTLIDVFGDDERVENSARISYSKGTKKTSNTRNLIRYLMKHEHWSPFEMCEVMFELKMPLFIVQQLLRHRTANINQMSLRYSEAIDEFYVPKGSYLKKQSLTNKQGGSDEIVDKDKEGCTWLLNASHDHSLKMYEILLGRKEHSDKTELCYDPYGEGNLLQDDFEGISRELARMVLPASNYTKLVWKCDLRNFMHFLKLRLDHHAQQEIRDYAQAMYDLTKEKFPICFEAFEDYVNQAVKVTGLERKLLDEILSSESSAKTIYAQLKLQYETEEDFAKNYGLSKRELDDFEKVWKLN